MIKLSQRDPRSTSGYYKREAKPNAARSPASLFLKAYDPGSPRVRQTWRDWAIAHGITALPLTCAASSQGQRQAGSDALW